MRATHIATTVLVAAIVVVVVGKSIQSRTSASSASKAARPTSQTAKPQARVSRPQNLNSSAGMAQLAQQGERGVARLAALLKSDASDEIRRQAAEELARLGTPSAMRELLAALATLPDGDLKEDIARLISTSSNPQAAVTLLDSLGSGSDPAELRAAQASLAQMADGNVIDEIVARYDVASDKTEKDRLVNVLASIQNSDALDTLIELAERVYVQAGDPLATAAIKGIASVGTGPAASYLLQQLEHAQANNAAQYTEALMMTNNSEAQSTLASAAQGNKEATQEQTRVAATLALGNYRDEQTTTVLQQLAAETTTAVGMAAQTALQAIRQPSGTP